MKFVLALCALLFAVQANAATYRYEFQAKLIEEVFYPPYLWYPGYPDYPGGYNSPGRQTVTLDNNPYEMTGVLSGLRDGQWHDAVVEFNLLPSYPLAEMVTCRIGHVNCSVGQAAYYEYASGGFLQIGQVWQYNNGSNYAGRFEFSKLGTSGGIVFGNDSVSCKGEYRGAPIDCEGYYAFLDTRVPVTPTPLPAGGLLLMTGLAGLSLSRRSRSHRHPLREL